MSEQEPDGPSTTSAARAERVSNQASNLDDCTEAVLRLFEYLDGEMTADDGARLQAHLDACAPCLREYRVDQALKAVVKRSCVRETAPVELRTTILRRLTVVTVETTD